MKFTYALIAGTLLAALPVRAVYAPIPEPEQGKTLTTTIRSNASYDSNIFGSPTDAISSSVYELSPRIAYNRSLGDQTFFSAQYGLTLTQIENRPGDTLLDSHDVTLRLAHAFTKATTIDINESFMIAKNPESTLNGVPVNTDQSFKRNQVDARLTTSITPKSNIVAKVRSINMEYRNAVLGRALDRIENLYGLAGDYAIVPEAKAVVEYRHQDVFYWKEGETKNKNSEYVMVGLDYEAAKKLSLSGRLGSEWRTRSREESTTGPFIEFSGRYQYAEKSFLTGGYAHTLDESSDTSRFTDQRVNRFFVNVQHSITARIVASASVNYEPATLQARRNSGVADLKETTTRAGMALSYLPTQNWTVTLSYDFDQTSSDETSRSTERHRAGLGASYAF